MRKKEGVKVIVLYLGILLIAFLVRREVFLKVLALEILSLLVLWWARKKEREKEQKERMKQLEDDYLDIVNQLTSLIAAGMTVRQALNKITEQYIKKKKNKISGKRLAYEEIYGMSRRIAEGENERWIYQEYANRAETLCFRRLMRLFLNDLEKGAQDLTVLLEEECRQAYATRLRSAKKGGEEASTKMLIPLMIMMMVVMAIVLIPAILSFHI